MTKRIGNELWIDLRDLGYLVGLPPLDGHMIINLETGEIVLSAEGKEPSISSTKGPAPVGLDQDAPPATASSPATCACGCAEETPIGTLLALDLEIPVWENKEKLRRAEGQDNYDRNTLIGYSNISLPIMVIDPDLSPPERAHLFLHELVHIVDGLFLGGVLAEAQVSQLGRGLAYILRRNPWFIEEVFGEVLE